MHQDVKSPAVCVRIIRDEQHWDSIKPQWIALFKASPYAATPLRFLWLRGWWRHYGRSYAAQGRGLQIITVWRDEQLIGALPLYGSRLHVSFLGVRRLGFLSTGESTTEETCPDYMNILCLPGEETVCLRLMQDAMRRMDWDVLEFVNVPERSPLLKDHSWCDGPWEIVANEGCPVANMQGGFETYLGRLNSKHRKNNRRVLRSAAEAGAALELADESNVGEFFDDLVRTHQSRWNALGEPGCFASPRFTGFHRDMAVHGVANGQAVLARLRVRDEIIATVYGFVTGEKFDVYQSGVGVTEKGPVASPGVASHLLLMAKLCERGVTAYDFLRGSCQYKNALATEKTLLFTIRAWRPTVRSMAHRSCSLLGVKMKSDPVRSSQPQVA